MAEQLAQADFRAEYSWEIAMSVKLPVSFPSEAEQLRRQAELTQDMTFEERILAAADTLAAAEVLSVAGDCREAQLAYHARCEQEWHDRMKEFMAAHVHDTPDNPE